MKIFELLDKSCKFTTQDFARRADGSPVWPTDESAAKFCFAGAVIKCYPDREDQDRIFDLIRTETNNLSCSTWGDRHGYEKVIELARKLNI